MLGLSLSLGFQQQGGGTPILGGDGSGTATYGYVGRADAMDARLAALEAL